MTSRQISDQEISQLATYNEEVSRGIVHTETWKLRMSVLQELFDDRHKGFPRVGPYVIVGPPEHGDEVDHQPTRGLARIMEILKNR